MRMDFVGDSILERIGLALGKVPVPVGRAFFGMPAARSVGVAQRIGVFRELAGGPATLEALSDRLAVHADPLRMLLDLLTGDRLLAFDHERYRLTRVGRKWLDPASGTYVGTFVEHSVEYWDWWGDLEGVLRDGPASHQDHGVGPDDPSWPVYIRGQYELARLSAGDVAKAIALPAGATRVLDLAGGHGWFAAELCKRHPGVTATVVDLAGSVRVGEAIMQENGVTAVEHVVGDMFESDLGGPYDAVLLFSILHHLGEAERRRLLARAHAALRPGGVVCVLDMFRPDAGGRRVASGATFELFFHLTSGAGVMSEHELHGHLAAVGFGGSKRVRVKSIPDYRLYLAAAESNRPNPRQTAENSALETV